MGIEKALAKILKREVDFLDAGSSEQIDLEQLVRHISGQGLDSHPDFFLDQPIDTRSYEPVSGDNVLGTYTPMRSPGRLELRQDAIRNFFWGTCAHVLHRNPAIWITRDDLKNTVDVFVLKVWWHEQFHFCCDVFRHLFPSTFDPLIEEALAVAYSRHKLLTARQSSRSALARIHPQFFAEVTRKAYSYTSPGYRDWPQYSDPVIFIQELISYALPHGNILEANGVDVPRMLTDLINSLLAREQAGYVEVLA